MAAGDARAANSRSKAAGANWDVADAEWTVGTRDILDFLRHQAWAGFDPQNDEYDRERLEDSFRARA